MFSTIKSWLFSTQPTTGTADLILLDDEEYVIKVWRTFAERKGKDLVAFSDAKRLLAEIRQYEKDTPVFVDVQLKSDITGLDVARKIVEQGFTNVYFTTSHAGSELNDIAGIRGTIDKRFPSWIG